MANEYRTWIASTEQDWVTRFDQFLVHTVGWYRAFTHSDSGSDRRYSWVSEGESNDGRPPRIIHVQGTIGELRLDCGFVGSYDFLGSFGSIFVGNSSNAELRGVSTPGRCRAVADKDRAWLGCEAAATTRISGYLGYIDSFYSAEDDPQPIFVRGHPVGGDDWTQVTNIYGLVHTDAEGAHTAFFNTTQTNEGYPNPRNGEFSFYSPIIYYNGTVQFYEVRGRFKGIFYGKPDRLGHGSFVTIEGKKYLVTKTTDEADAIVVGPVSDNGEVPQDVVQLGFPNVPYLKTDYAVRGLSSVTGGSGTFSLWRFDVGHLNNYKYGSGASLPVPTVYLDETGNNPLTPVNGLGSVISRLREAADFTFPTQPSTAAVSFKEDGVLLNEWTYECVFKPDTIPTGASLAPLIMYSAVGASEPENTLMAVSIIAASGTTPDEYQVERGNIRVEWEKNSGSAIVLQTSGDFVQQNRWNYLAVTKNFNGSKYDLDVWHCSFGDYRVPSLEQSFTNIDNATGGANSSWFIGRDPAATSFYDGQMDDTRITKSVVTQSGIETSCSRSML